MLCTLDPPVHPQPFSLVLGNASKSKFYLNRRTFLHSLTSQNESFRLEKTFDSIGSNC